MTFYRENFYEIIKNSKGDIYKFANSRQYSNFIKGDIYFSRINSYSTKSWRRHTKLSCVIGVVYGETIIKLKPADNANVIKKILHINKGSLLQISPMTWYSFENKKNTSCLLFVMLDSEHDDNEVERL